ncbi:hypothetical protein GGD81_001379 [Rhodobium orientis]|uniref:Gp5/Type VI secretion system Vgr protein OB-fold domain-containing protein n=1 Tax=Rhodobium orientis TaxID=34017 RepID=A0A327JM18_9HYPH|nr:hypothetical protein [Rhodobium orientis]MBB4302352.1 hypothetical protein [Rhodobium orientis]MBK5949057.1 hypothetical protein [Rhodobium orientis]RAI26616.1 hypothetical protein CH339_13525 [Rhodobium orientis]
MSFEGAFRDMYKRFEDLDRRLASVIVNGRVAEVRWQGDRQEIRMEIAPLDPRTGKKTLSPWVQVQDLAGAGGGEFSSSVPVAVNEPMRLLSPSGEVGPGSIAIRDSHDDDNPNPATDHSEAVLRKGDTTVGIKGDRHRIETPAHLVKSDRVDLGDEGGPKVARVGDLVHVQSGSSAGYWPIVSGSEKVRAT